MEQVIEYLKHWKFSVILYWVFLPYILKGIETVCCWIVGCNMLCEVAFAIDPTYSACLVMDFQHSSSPMHPTQCIHQRNVNNITHPSSTRNLQVMFLTTTKKGRPDLLICNVILSHPQKYHRGFLSDYCNMLYVSILFRILILRSKLILSISIAFCEQIFIKSCLGLLD